uniref:G_PROTEIN_RECEP_F1_2 domain-containing protein n=1 Tax=Panagrellus redivivus TaxID=6233 RepID=A0A7E4URK8_PANRE
MRIFALPFDAQLNNENETSQFEGDGDHRLLYFIPRSLAYHIGIAIFGGATIGCLFANVLTIFVLMKSRPLQKSISNLYILSLSVADLLIGVCLMSVKFINDLQYPRFENFFGPKWFCRTWQASDFILSSISLYSIVAIALDRVWNLEKPLRVFKRSRKLAKKIIVGIWVLPCVIWIPYFIFLEKDNHSDGCRMSRENAFTIPVVAGVFFYSPAIALIGFFIRISMVVHNHLKFLKAHSTVRAGLSSSSPMQDRPGTGTGNNLNSLNSIQKEYNSSLRVGPEKRNTLTYDSLTTTTSGYCTTTLRTPRSNSPWFPKSEFQLAPLSEERSSGRERSQSEQINLTPEAKNNLEITDSRSHSKISDDGTRQNRRQSIVARQLLLMQRAEAFFNRKTSSESMRLGRPASARSRYSSMDSTTSSIGGPAKIFRKVSNLSRNSSIRFSVIAIPGNLADLLLQRDFFSQQVKAAKAVALITCCFLICWFPFLIIWPIKIYCNDCISDEIYHWSIWLNYVCSTLNPILYTLSSPRAQFALKSYINFGKSNGRKKGASFYKSNTVV